MEMARGYTMAIGGIRSYINTFLFSTALFVISIASKSMTLPPGIGSEVLVK
jgi:hypothetical protein